MMGSATTSQPPYRIFHWRMKETPMYAVMAKGRDDGKLVSVRGPNNISHQPATKAGPTKMAVLNQGFALANFCSPKDQ